MLLMRRLSAVTVVAILLGVLPATSMAGEVKGENGEVVFRVTLEGPVDPTHSFAVRHQCEYPAELCVTEDIVVVCAPPHPLYDGPICSATTYEFSSFIPAESPIAYALLRWVRVPTVGEEHVTGSWIVHAGRQVISLGYVYPGDTPSQPSAGPVLPDTALPKVPTDR